MSLTRDEGTAEASAPVGLWRFAGLLHRIRWWPAARPARASRDVVRPAPQDSPAHDTSFPVFNKNESAPLVADILGLAPPEVRDAFLVVHVDDDVTLDFVDVDGFEPQQYTFIVGDQELDEIASRLTERSIPFWADADKERPREVSTGPGGRVLFWEEPSGHLLEIGTGSYDGLIPRGSEEPSRRSVPDWGLEKDHWAQGPGLLASVRRYKLLVCALALLCGALAYAAESQRPVRYAGVARLFLDEPTSSSSDPGRVVRNRAEFLRSRPVMVQAAKIAGNGETATGLARRVTVKASSDVDVVTISVLGQSAKEAAMLANSVVSAYEQVIARQAQQQAAVLASREQELATEITRLVARRAKAPDDPALAVEEQAKRDQLLVIARQREQAAASSPQGAVERAAPPDAPAQPRPLRASVVGGLAGLVLGMGIAWWLAGRPAARSG